MFRKSGRYDPAPPSRMQKYPPQNMQGPPQHMASNHHQTQQQQQPNYNYQNTSQSMQHQPNYYGSQANGTGYDQQSQGINHRNVNLFVFFTELMPELA